MIDLRFAFRQLRKTPGFTLLAVITLALGIGLNTAIFSLINDIFLRGLPFEEPARVLHILGRSKQRPDLDFPLGAPRFMHYRDAQTIFFGQLNQAYGSPAPTASPSAGWQGPVGYVIE